LKKSPLTGGPSAPASPWSPCFPPGPYERKKERKRISEKRKEEREEGGKTNTIKAANTGEPK